MSDSTIRDFGAQWTRHPESHGYYASAALFADLVEPLLPVARVRGARVVEIGSGAGRIAAMLVEAGAREVVAVEPSDAIEVLRCNVAAHADRVRCVHATGDRAPDVQADLVLSIGVLHHVADPLPVARRAYEILRPGGTAFFWLYGREGNEAYLRIAEPLRRVTRRLPDPALVALAHALNVALGVYVALCRVGPLPLRRYAREVLARFDRRTRYLTIFDQLNPGYAKYYRREEAVALARDAGFANVRVHHRHGYSWSVIGEKPER